MSNIQVYWLLLIDIIMKVIAFFKKDNDEKDEEK